VTSTIPVAVVIPTFNRGRKVISILERIQECDPKPAEMWVHIDLSDGDLERELNRRFPNVRILTSSSRLGCSGGRHRCFCACGTPYAVSFDDDSYPVDCDFFLRVERLFSEYPRAAVIGASIWHRHEAPRKISGNLVRTASYIGCGHAVRLSAYREVRGLIPRAVGYGMEESDLSLQLFVVGWHIYESGELRVFHDTELAHHVSPEITAGAIANVGLYAFLHYPVMGWGVGLLQLANKVAYSLRMGRMRGICSGILGIPGDCYRYRQYRKPIPWRTVARFLRFRRSVVAVPSGADEVPDLVEKC